jgi:hypothetical protein
LGGVIFECTFAVLLFAYDEHLSGAQTAAIRMQSDKIIALESRLAARTLPDDERSALSIGLEKYAGTEYELITYKSDKEAADIAGEISLALTGGGWKEVPAPSPGGIYGVIAGTVVYANDKAELQAVSAATALAEQLNKRNIATTVRRSETGELPNRLIIFVGIKP